MANENIFANWTFRRKLPAPFDIYSDDPVRMDICSVHCTQLKGKSTLHAASLRAILAYMELEEPSGSVPEYGAIGTQGNFTIAEYPSKTGELHAVIYNQQNGKMYVSTYQTPPDLDKDSGQYHYKEGMNSGAALLFALLPVAFSDDEFREQYEELKKHRNSGYSNMEKATKSAAILCDNLYRRCRYENGRVSIPNSIPSRGSLARIKAFTIEQGTYNPTNVIAGSFKIFTPGATSKKSHSIISKSDFVSNYILSDSRRLTPKEELTVPVLEDWYIIPKEIQRICEHAKMTTGTTSPMRNFLLRGPAGTGKTEGAKAIAAGLHLPYRCITCSANTEILDILGQILPDVDEHKTSYHRDFPSFQDIVLDPSTAYEKLSGIYDENISEEDVYQKLIESIMEKMKEQSNDNSATQHFKYVDTPLVEAIRNGYLCEIQEPNVIANPGVLVGLNSLLDRCQSVFLPNGEIIERHPDTVIVVTTNQDYAGCKPMNQSVLSRMNLKIDLEEPDEDTLVKRVLGITGCTDKKAVQTMAQITKTISEYCRENLITDGCCGVRELIAWVQSFMICGDIQEAARYTILTSVSADSENQIDVENSCILPLLNS